MSINTRKNSILADWGSPNLGSPQFPQALNTVDGLIDARQLNLDNVLKLLLPTWRAPDDDDYAYIEYSLVGVGAWKYFDEIHFPVQPSGPMIAVDVPMSEVAHGRYEFRFKVKNGIGGTYLDFSRAGMADIDLRAPYEGLTGKTKPPLVTFPTSLPVGQPITQDVIDANPDFDFTIDSYTDWAPGDMCEYWFTTDNPADDGLPLNCVPVPDPALGIPFVIDLPNTFFANPNVIDDMYFFVYRLIDAAYNRSELSRTQGRLLKRSSGLVLDPIIVREQTPDGLIDIAEWEAGVKVAIPLYPFMPGDHVIVQWGSQKLSSIPLSGILPFDIPIPPQLILDEYGANVGPTETLVTYTILRSGGTDSPPSATSIDVDLSVPGPTPVVPGEENPALGEVHVFGPVSATEDYLGKDDFTDAGDIVARLTLWLTPTPVAGNIITVYWGSKLIVAGTHIISEAGGAPIEIPLDKAAIAPAGNAVINVFYTVRVEDSNNGNLSASTPVTVDDAIEHIMAEAVFQHIVPWLVDPRGRVNCSSLRPVGDTWPVGGKHLEVYIPPSAEFFDDGVDVLVEFYSSIGLLGDQLIVGSEGSDTVTLNAATAANGFTFELKPFDPILKAADGLVSPWTSIWFRYSVNVNGTWARSVAAVSPARMVSANNYCDGTPLP